MTRCRWHGLDVAGDLFSARKMLANGCGGVIAPRSDALGRLDRTGRDRPPAPRERRGDRLRRGGAPPPVRAPLRGSGVHRRRCGVPARWAPDGVGAGGTIGRLLAGNVVKVGGQGEEPTRSRRQPGLWDRYRARCGGGGATMGGIRDHRSAYGGAGVGGTGESAAGLVCRRRNGGGLTKTAQRVADGGSTGCRRRRRRTGHRSRSGATSRHGSRRCGRGHRSRTIAR